MAHHRILILLLTWTTYYHSVSSNKPLSPFEKAIQEPAFVDKTELLKTFFLTALQTNCYNALITCPSRFGKSSNVDMIKRFIEHTDDQKVKTDNENLFKNPKLNLNDVDFFKQHFAKYSVLYLNFSVDDNKTTHEEISGVIGEQIKQLFTRYSWLYQPPTNGSKHTYPKAEHKDIFAKIQSGEANSSVLTQSLKVLSEDLSNYLDGDRDIILLIDDYDGPIRKAMECGANAKDIIPIIHSLLKNALDKNNIMINYVFIVGTFVFDGFKDTIAHFNFLEEHKFLEYFGFTFKNMQKLHATRYGTSDSEKEWNNLERFYNGYQSQTGKDRLFNPASINRYFKEKKFQSYWPQTGYSIQLDERLKSKPLREKIQNLILNKVSVFKQEVALTPASVEALEEALSKNDTRTAFKPNQVSTLLSTLFNQGYLSYTTDSTSQDFRTFRLPNEEVRLQLTSDLFKYFQKVIQDCSGKSKNVFKSFQAILEGNSTEEELKKQTLTALRDVMDPFYALGKYDYEQLTLDFHSFIYASLIYGGEPAEQYDSIALGTIVDRAVENKLKEDGGSVDLSIWSKDESVLLYVEMKTYPRYKTLKDAINYAKTFRPSAQSTKKPKYLRLLLIYLNISKKVEVGFGPRMEYSDGKWISTPEPSTTPAPTTPTSPPPPSTKPTTKATTEDDVEVITGVTEILPPA